MPEAPPSRLSTVVITLLRGFLDRTTEPQRWHDLLELRAAVGEYLTVLGLVVVIDEREGYAFLKHNTPEEDEAALPKLVRRRPLSYDVSLLLALLRKRMAEHEATSGDRLIVTLPQMTEMLRIFLPVGEDERKVVRDIRRPIREILELGFIRQLKDRDDEYEVLRILRAYVDANWLSDFANRLEQYRQHAVTKQQSDEE